MLAAGFVWDTAVVPVGRRRRGPTEPEPGAREDFQEQSVQSQHSGAPSKLPSFPEADGDPRSSRRNRSFLLVAIMKTQQQQAPNV